MPIDIQVQPESLPKQDEAVRDAHIRFLEWRREVTAKKVQTLLDAPAEDTCDQKILMGWRNTDPQWKTAIHLLMTERIGHMPNERKESLLNALERIILEGGASDLCELATVSNEYFEVGDDSSETEKELVRLATEYMRTAISSEDPAASAEYAGKAWLAMRALRGGSLLPRGRTDLSALNRFPNDELLERCRDLLIAPPNNEVLCELLAFVGECGDETFVPVLGNILSTVPDEGVLSYTIRALGYIGGTESSRVLIRFIKKPGTLVKLQQSAWEAINALRTGGSTDWSTGEDLKDWEPADQLSRWKTHNRRIVIV